MSERFYLSLLVVVLACLLALAPVSQRATSAASPGATSATNAEAARRALAEGAALLRRNRADLALPLLESALRLFTEASDASGLAAASDALGDIYLRHGQYKIAAEHFRRAAEAFRARRETANAALMFAKLGEAYYLSGDEAAARAAFARIGEGEKRDDGAGLNAGANASGGRNNGGAGRGGRAASTFASVSALLPGLSACALINPNTNSPQNAAQPVLSAANNVAAVAAPGGNTPNNPLNNSPRNPSGNAANNSASRPTGRQPNNPSSNSPNNPSGNSTNNPSGNSTSGRPNNPSNSSPGNNSTGNPSNNPSGNPSNNPSSNPSSNPGNNSTRPGNNSSNKPSGRPSNKPSNEPPNMGRAPKKLDDLGRMDLRVVDEQGNPVKGAKGRLSTQRPNGIDCDCWEVTNAAGRAVLPPIHVGKVLKLEVNAPGYEPLEQIVPAEQLAAPFKVTLKAKDALNSTPRGSGQKFAHAPLRRPEAARSLTQPAPEATAPAVRTSENAANAESAPNTENASNAENAPGAESTAASLAAPFACFDFYRLFVAYSTSELRLARADFDNNRTDSAQAHYRNVLAAADTDAPAGNLAAARLFRAVARTSLGDIALRQSRFTDALKFYGQAAEIARRDGRAELTWGAERGLGKTYWVLAAGASDAQTEAKHRDAALKHYRAALDIIETLFAGSLRADNARSNFLATTKDVFEEAAGVLSELVLMNAPPAPRSQSASAHASNAEAARPLEGQSLAYAAEAFRIVEQGKARSLLDMLGEARAEVREGVPAALLEQKAANMARQQEIANLLGGVGLAGLQGDAPTKSVAELEAELERLSVEFDSLENRIRTSSPRYAALVRAEPLTLAEVQRQVLDDSTVLLEYSLGTHQSYLFAATQTGLTLHRLPPRERIERQAIELRQQLIPAGVRRAIAGINVENTRGLTLGSPSTAPANVSAYSAAAHALYKTVVAPAAASLGNRRVLVVPDGALNYVPFESLVTNTQGVDYSTLSYLVKTNEMVYAPSASVVAEVRRQARRDAQGRGGMLLVADPVFDAGDLRLQGSSQGAARARESVQRMSLASALADVTNVREGTLKLARLDGTRSEAEEIAKFARANGGQADMWLDFDASEANLNARKLDGYRVLHFATHGLLDSERPQFTGLALSLVGQKDADGFLRVDEVFNLRLGSPLVMLSACETGLGKERRGEGVIGLTRAFMYAGAPTVGVSLWSVGDKSTAELMPEFYRRLLTGREGAPAAMRASQLAMIAGKRYSAPFYWSPFVIVGDWR